MAEGARNGTNPPLGSDWGGLSSHLIATFFAVKKGPAVDDKSTVVWVRDLDQPEVRAPLTDGNLEAKLNWISPFENVGIDQKLSSFSAMLQAGGFSSLLSELEKNIPALASSLGTLRDQARTLEGKSNLTKLNSTQVFQGMPPISISVTAHFRAMKDAITEVRDPINQLIEWSLPKKIAPDGPVVGLAAGSINAYASEVPQIIGMKFADTLFAPIVIESIPYPLTGPRDSNGIMTVAALPMQLATLTALDKTDWQNTRSARHSAQFNY